jgi:hypothetical protein
MDQSHSSEANSHSFSQEIPRLLRNPQVHYSVQKRQSFRFLTLYPYFYTVRSFSPSLNPQGRVPPIISCPLLLIQHIRSNLPYLETVPCIRNLRTRHVIVLVTHLTWILKLSFSKGCTALSEAHNGVLSET